MNAEEMVIGCCLLSGDVIRFAADTIKPDDFASANLAEVFRAIVHLKKQGQPVEPFSVWKQAEEYGVKGLTMAQLMQWVEGVGSARSVGFYADQVKEASTRRRLRMVGMKLTQSAADETLAPSAAVTEGLDGLKAIRTNTLTARLESVKLREVLAIEEDHDWIVPGLFERGDRMIITGYEGLGKSTWIRQMAVCFAAGINPVTLDHIDPVRVQVVDVENSQSQWRKEVRGMTRVAAKHGTADPENLDLCCEGRIDLTKDADLGLVHRLVDENRPDILFIGPIYKMVPKGITNDDDAAPLITALDSLRDRGVVLVMEGHSPKGGGQVARDLSPRGSAALMGWPEFGFGLSPDADGAVVQRWRGDRDAGRQWPRKLHRGGPFPWTADNVADSTRRKFYGWKQDAA
jgi:replicative DNA helicase